MDPIIESQEWEDFNTGFISKFSAALVPLIRPRYVVRKERRIYVEHSWPDPSQTIRSDVAILGKRGSAESEPCAGGGIAAPFVVSLPMPEEHRESYLTVRERATMTVVTVVELRSPGNKRSGSGGRREYLSKREEILASRTHQVELDMLRGGERLPTIDRLPRGDYYAFIRRSPQRYKAAVFAWSVRDPFPRIPIPLADGDPDVEIDLGKVFTSAYDRSGYDYSLDYRRAVKPRVKKSDAAWIAKILKGVRP
jgi:hypothetical protein